MRYILQLSLDLTHDNRKINRYQFRFTKLSEVLKILSQVFRHRVPLQLQKILLRIVQIYYTCAEAVFSCLFFF